MKIKPVLDFIQKKISEDKLREILKMNTKVKAVRRKEKAKK
jgi:FixJ family two-component response regulator